MNLRTQRQIVQFRHLYKQIQKKGKFLINFFLTYKKQTKIPYNLWRWSFEKTYFSLQFSLLDLQLIFDLFSVFRRRLVASHLTFQTDYLREVKEDGSKVTEQGIKGDYLQRLDLFLVFDFFTLSLNQIMKLLF